MKTTRLIPFLFVSITLIVICFYCIDKPVVYFLVQHHSRQYSILKIMANDIVSILTAVIFFYYLYFAIRLLQKTRTRFEKKLLICCNTVVIALFMRTIFKMIFGRFWTATFICNNPSLVKNQAYGFNWFKVGTAYGSFPSGHTTFIFAFSVSLWFLFPKLRWLWVLLILAVIVGQIGMYYHFISDVIAGAVLGTLVAVFVHRYLNLSSASMR